MFARSLRNVVSHADAKILIVSLNSCSQNYNYRFFTSSKTLYLILHNTEYNNHNTKKKHYDTHLFIENYFN